MVVAHRPRPERKPATQTPTIVETTDSAPKAKQSESEKEVKVRISQFNGAYMIECVVMLLYRLQNHL